MMNTTVKDFIYTGGAHSHLRGGVAKLDPSQCSFSVAEYGRMTDWHQCTRKPAETVEGYGFCKQHANEVKSRLGIRTDATKTKYAAKLSYGIPTLIELQVLSETESMIEIAERKPLMGDGMYGLYQGRLKKTSQYTKDYKFFDFYEDAVLWLYQESESAWQQAKKNLQKSIETMNEMKRMVQESVEQRR